MKLKYQIISVILIFFKNLNIESVVASTIDAISVTNNVNQATVILDCTDIPIYMIFSLHNPERIVIDLSKIFKVQKNIFPISFNGINLIKCIRTNISVNHKSMRIVLDLVSPANIKTIMQGQTKENCYCIMLKILKKKSSTITDMNIHKIPSVVYHKNYVNTNQVTNNKKRVLNVQLKKNQNNRNILLSPIVVAIDAGHGGQDPGATGCHGIYEKNITINIAKKLKILLDLDPNFKAVMTREGDYFLSVKERSNMARKKGADVLISIHADSALNTNVRGASVWVLSNSRVKSEMTHWLQRSEKHSELLGGVGDILANYPSDPYFSHLVLDLQFGYAQQVAYDIAVHVLSQLKNIMPLHKNTPEYSGFAVLRSPDIPSILVETGFISNIKEEYLLTSNGYQEKIANALYRGLCFYFKVSQKKVLNRLQTQKTYITVS